MSRQIIQGVVINKNQETIFNSLLNPSAIIKWWQANTAIVVKEDNGIYAVCWGSDIDDPEYVSISSIKNYTPFSNFSLNYSYYSSKHGKLPFVTDMTVEFIISSESESRSILEVKQTGIPKESIADEYYEGCIVGWKTVLENIKNYCEDSEPS